MISENRCGDELVHMKLQPLQEEVLQESVKMVPDCQRRLNNAYTDLQSLLVSVDKPMPCGASRCASQETAQDLNTGEEYQAAKDILDSITI